MKKISPRISFLNASAKGWVDEIMEGYGLRATIACGLDILTVTIARSIHGQYYIYLLLA